MVGSAREPPVDARRHVEGVSGHIAMHVVDRWAPERVNRRLRKRPSGRGHRNAVVGRGAHSPAAAELVHLRLIAHVVCARAHRVAEQGALDGQARGQRAQVESHQHEINVGPAGHRRSGATTGESTCKRRAHEGSSKDTVMRPVASANDGAEAGHSGRRFLVRRRRTVSYCPKRPRWRWRSWCPELPCAAARARRCRSS